MVIVPGPTTLMELTPATTPVVSATKILVAPIATVALIVVVRKFTFAARTVDGAVNSNATRFVICPLKLVLPTIPVSLI